MLRHLHLNYQCAFCQKSEDHLQESSTLYLSKLKHIQREYIVTIELQRTVF